MQVSRLLKAWAALLSKQPTWYPLKISQSLNAPFFAEEICVQTWRPLRGTYCKKILRRNALFSGDFGFPLQIPIPLAFYADSLYTYLDAGKIAVFVTIVIMDLVALLSPNK